MRGHLNGNNLRIDLIGNDGLRKNKYLGDRTRTGGMSLGDREWDEAVGAGIGGEVGRVLGAGAGDGSGEEATMGSGVIRSVDLCWPGTASQFSGQVLHSQGHP